MGQWKDNAIISFLYAVIRIGLIILGIVITAILFAETILRLFGVSWTGYVEILIMAVSWVYMFGTARACYKDSYAGSGVLIALTRPGILQHTIRLIRWILTAVIGILMCWWGIKLCMWSVSQGNITGIYGLPMVIGYASMIFGTGVGSIFHVLHLIDHARFYIRTYIKKEVTA